MILGDFPRFGLILRLEQFAKTGLSYKQGDKFLRGTLAIRESRF